MLYSALINVMVKAARRAGRSLKRDLGEIEHLQVSLKGPANFVTKADKRAEEMLYEDLAKARPGYGFPPMTSSTSPSAARVRSSMTSGCASPAAAGSMNAWSPAACRISAAATMNWR